MGVVNFDSSNGMMLEQRVAALERQLSAFAPVVGQIARLEARLAALDAAPEAPAQPAPMPAAAGLPHASSEYDLTEWGAEPEATCHRCGGYPPCERPGEGDCPRPLPAYGDASVARVTARMVDGAPRIDVTPVPREPATLPAAVADAVARLRYCEDDEDWRIADALAAHARATAERDEARDEWEDKARRTIGNLSAEAILRRERDARLAGLLRSVGDELEAVADRYEGRGAGLVPGPTHQALYDLASRCDDAAAELDAGPDAAGVGGGA